MPADIDEITEIERKAAKDIATHFPTDEEAVLGHQQLQKVLIKQQHELNKESVRLAAKYAGTWAIIGALVGAIATAVLGAVLSVYLSKSPLSHKEETIRHEGGVSSGVDRHTKAVLPKPTEGKDDSVSSKTPR